MIDCNYCTRRFNTQAALNWHLQKDKVCISKRPKLGKSKSSRNRQSINATGIDYENINVQKSSRQPPNLQNDLIRQSNIEAKSVNIAVGIDTKSIAVQQKKQFNPPPPVPPKHKRITSKTELDLEKINIASEPMPNRVSTEVDSSSSDMVLQLQTQIDALKEANSKMMQEKINYAEEVIGLKAKIIKQDEELHHWKDKMLTKKEKLVGEDLKNELITLILDSDLNIQQVPDDVERQIYGFIIDKLSNNRGLFTKLFCCK